MSEIHRRIGIVVETLGDMERLVQAGKDAGYDETEPIGNGRDNRKSPIYIYFERGSSQPEVEDRESDFTGRCSHCMRPSVPANADGVALRHNTGDTDHSGACRGSGTKVTGLRKVGRS